MCIRDRNTKELFGARDIFGIKPFYYYKKGKEFMFGSEIKSFLSHPNFEKELDEDMIPLYLSYEYSPDERTIFKNVFKLPGAHCFTYKNGELKVERYYKIEYKIEDDKSLEYWEDAITKEFTESVSMHPVSYTHLDVYKRQVKYTVLFWACALLLAALFTYLIEKPTAKQLLRKKKIIRT